MLVAIFETVLKSEVSWHYFLLRSPTSNLRFLLIFFHNFLVDLRVFDQVDQLIQLILVCLFVWFGHFLPLKIIGGLESTH